MWCYLMLLLTVLPLVASDNDWTSDCPTFCRCKWVSGKKSADCSDASLQEIPPNLSPDLQSLNLSLNDIYHLKRREFESASLINLHKLYLRNCGIHEIHQDAFEGLKILIELDLSENKIHILKPTTFAGTERLRVVLFNYNNVEIIESGLFSNLKYLQRVEFTNNNITNVSSDAFKNDPKLLHIVLNDNRIRQMKPLTLNKEQKLSSLVLHNNPWKCDCKLKMFRNWTIEHNLYTPPTACEEPNHLRGRLWTEIASEQFACKPRILQPPVGTVIKLNTDSPFTIACKVYGDPVPSINWVLNGRIIDSRKNDEKHFKIHQNGYDTVKWVNLTIRNPRAQDRGELICSATNPGGVEERNVTVYVDQGILGVNSDGSTATWFWILIILVAFVFVFFLLLLIFYCFLRKKKVPLKDDMNTSNGGAVVEDPDMQKSLITAVNPVEKPPRRYEAPPSVASCGTEMSEINRTLLDNDSVFGPTNEAEEETHSLDFDNKPKHVQNKIPTEFIKMDRPYPPDLLSFPARALQISPAGSCSSTVPDHSRPLQHTLQSPLHSPNYGTLPAAFRTLPHSRSQSPFTSPGYTPVQSRQGYVTIPRRPRVPSWSAPSSSNGGEVVEPVYDNLGIRTTADGSSMLSLNKALEATPHNMRNRPLPATPTYHQNGLPMYYTPIDEHESPPAPCPSRPPSIKSNSMQRLASPSSPSDSNQDMWNHRSIPEGASMPKLSPTSMENKTGAQQPITNNNNIGRSPKVPPKPPPKPKTKAAVTSTLFEDEGEDGTEV